MSKVTHLLNSTLDVYRRALTSDGQGGQTYTYALLETARKVRLVQATPREQFEAEQAGASMTHKVYQDHDDDIRRGDEYRLGTKKYRVATVVEPSTDGVYRRADVELIQSEGVAP
jgi:SPP1 family predicted phage head-tail adaptor